MNSTSSTTPLCVLLEQLVAKARKSGSGQARLDLVTFLEEHRVPDRAADVLEHGWVLLQRHTALLGASQWRLYERVFAAALELGRRTIAASCLEKLEEQFPPAPASVSGRGGAAAASGSIRVLGLRAMMLEADQEYAKALYIYESILARKGSESNVHALKRRVAIAKAQSDDDSVVKALLALLDGHPKDSSAWAELAQTYMRHRQFDQASHCYEELVMAEPEHYSTHLHLAECLFSQGGARNLSNARPYFAQAVELAPENARALSGLLLCCRALLDRSPADGDSKALFALAAERLVDLYEQREVAVPSYVTDALKFLSD